MNNKQYILDEEDLQKLHDNSEKMLVKLKQCIVHPSSIIVIEPYYEEYHKKAIPSATGGYALSEEMPPPPVEDLFNKGTLQIQ